MKRVAGRLSFMATTALLWQAAFGARAVSSSSSSAFVRPLLAARSRASHATWARPRSRGKPFTTSKLALDAGGRRRNG